MEFFEPFRMMTMICAGAMVVIACTSFASWKRWSRSKRVLAWAVTAFMLVNGYAALEATLEGTPGGPRSLAITSAMGVGLIATIIAVRDDTKDASDKRHGR